MPPTQTKPAPTIVPHEPQLSSLLDVSTHWSSQRVSLEVHGAAHVLVSVMQSGLEPGHCESIVQPTQVLLDVSHTGVTPLHWASLMQSTHAWLVVSQACPPTQSALLAQSPAQFSASCRLASSSAQPVADAAEAIASHPALMSDESVAQHTRRSVQVDVGGGAASTTTWASKVVPASGFGSVIIVVPQKPAVIDVARTDAQFASFPAATMPVHVGTSETG
jgi:hypothetical protein